MYSIKYFDLDNTNPGDFLSLQIGETQSTIQQIGLEETSDELMTTIKYLGLSENSNYHKYVIEHEGVKEINGRYQNEPINYYIASNKLELYKHHDENHIFIKGANELVKSALTDLQNSNILKVVDYKVNILELIKNTPNIFIKGGWFGKLKISNVTSAGIFGAEVNDSEMWEELESKGDLSAVVFQITSGVTAISVMVNKYGSLLLYNKWNEDTSISQAIDVVDNIRGYFNTGV